MITDLTGLDIANASMLDEGTAAAEAMAICRDMVSGRDTFFVSELCHPQTIEVVQTRAKPLGLRVVVGDHNTFDFADASSARCCNIRRPTARSSTTADFIKRAHDAGALAIVAADLLSLTLAEAAGRVRGGCGRRKHAALRRAAWLWRTARGLFRDARCAQAPDARRLVGVSHDAEGRPGFRLSLQTREQHIRRDKATSNICTAQVLLAVMASMYAVYHGPRGLREIAQRVHDFAAKLAAGLEQLGLEIAHEEFFDTIRVELGEATSADLMARAERAGCNLRQLGPHSIGIAVDETTTDADIETLMSLFRGTNVRDFEDDELDGSSFGIPESADAHFRVPDASGLQQLPHRDGDAALSAAAGGAGPLAHALR